MNKILLAANYALVTLSIILGTLVSNYTLIILVIPFFISAYMQIKIYDKKNHFALKVFYSLTLMIPFPLEKLVEKLVRMKYNRLTPRVLNILNKSGIKYHAVYGTFLFMHRNNSFMDNDIDLAVWENEWSSKEMKKMEEIGFVLKETFIIDGVIKEYCFKHKDFRISLDIFPLKKSSPKAYGFDPENKRYATKPYDYKYELKKYNVNNVEIMGPKDPEKYLNWIYGDWQKPDPNYHWLYGSSTRPNKIVENANIEYKKY